MEAISVSDPLIAIRTLAFVGVAHAGTIEDARAQQHNVCRQG